MNRYTISQPINIYWFLKELIMGTVKKLFALDEGIARELDIVAAAINKSQKEVVETALDFYFDYTDGIVADKITEEIKNGKMKVLDSNEVYDKLGIDLWRLHIQIRQLMISSTLMQLTGPSSQKKYITLQRTLNNSNGLKKCVNWKGLDLQVNTVTQ